MKAVILAGGLGTRLRPYTLFVPKGMLPLGSKPVLEHIIEWLSKNGITDIVLCVGYLSKVISDYFSNGKELGVKISYVRSSRPMGTAGQLKSAQKLLDESFICVYGDVILKNNLKKMISYHKSKKAIATIGLTKYSTKMSYGFIETEKNGLVRSWSEKPEISGLINAGLYVFEPSFLTSIPKGTIFGMDSAFESVIKGNKKVFGYEIEGGFLDIGDRRAYLSADRKYISELETIP